MEFTNLTSYRSGLVALVTEHDYFYEAAFYGVPTRAESEVLYNLRVDDSLPEIISLRPGRVPLENQEHLTYFLEDAASKQLGVIKKPCWEADEEVLEAYQQDLLVEAPSISPEDLEESFARFGRWFPFKSLHGYVNKDFARTQEAVSDVYTAGATYDRRITDVLTDLLTHKKIGLSSVHTKLTDLQLDTTTIIPLIGRYHQASDDIDAALIRKQLREQVAKEIHATYFPEL